MASQYPVIHRLNENGTLPQTAPLVVRLSSAPPATTAQPAAPIARPAQRSSSHGASLALVAVVLVLAAAFAGLALAAHNVPYFPIDLQAARAVQGVASPAFHSLMTAVSWPGFPPQVYIFVVIVAGGFFIARRRRQAVFLLGSAVGIAMVSQGVKLLVNRPRPPANLIHVLIPNLNGGKWSFPAGHVESYVVIFGFLIYLAVREWRAWLARATVIVLGVVMIGLIGLSRIDSGEHWLSDAAGGYLLGALFLIGVVVLYRYRRVRPASGGQDGLKIPTRPVVNGPDGGYVRATQILRAGRIDPQPETAVPARG